LPCSVVDVRDNVVKAVKDGGYLFTSFPVNGQSDTFDSLKEKVDNRIKYLHVHIREFNKQLIHELFSDLAIVSFVESRSPLYKHYQTLWLKEG